MLKKYNLNLNKLFLLFVVFFTLSLKESFSQGSGISRVRIDGHLLEFDAVNSSMGKVTQAIGKHIDSIEGGDAQVKHLDFSGNAIVNDSVEPLSDFLTERNFTSLETIDLSRNRITSKHLIYFLDILERPEFKLLNLLGNYVINLKAIRSACSFDPSSEEYIAVENKVRFNDLSRI